MMDMQQRIKQWKEKLHRFYQDKVRNYIDLSRQRASDYFAHIMDKADKLLNILKQKTTKVATKIEQSTPPQTKKRIDDYWKSIKTKLKSTQSTIQGKKITNIVDDVRRSSKKTQQLWYLPQAVMLEEMENKKLILIAVTIISSVLFLLLVWASLTKVQESAITFGEIVPVGEVRDVQHLEGGIVSAIFVQDGDIVSEGQPLIKLDDTAFLSQLQELQAKRLKIGVSVGRLRAFFSEQNLGVQYSEDLTDIDDDNEAIKLIVERLLSDEELLLNLQNEERKREADILEAQIDQRRELITKLKQQIVAHNENVVLLEQELEMFSELVEEGIVSRIQYIQKQREHNGARRDMLDLQGQLEEAEGGLTESTFRLEELEARSEREAIDKLSDLSSELFQIQFTINRLRDQVNRTVIRAPTDGVVTELTISPGSIVASGGELLKVVPFDETLQAEIRISTLDIGYVRIGDPVKIKVLTYDFARFGALNGLLTNISATTLTDEKGNPYYLGTVELVQQYVGEQRNKLLSGMTVQGDIITGNKTILQYILKPIQRSLESAFHER